MKKLLIIGKPFGYLEAALSEVGITYDIILDQSAKFKFNTNIDYGCLLLIGFNLSLNNSSLEKFFYIHKSIAQNIPIIYWNHEPFWDLSRDEKTLMFGRDIFHFNAFLNNVYTSPFSMYFGIGGYLWSTKRLTDIPMPDRDEIKRRFDAGYKRLCAFATCFHDKRLFIESSIVGFRNDFIKSAYDQGVCDVFGKSWSGKWSLEVTDESRAGREFDGIKKNWGELKIEQSKKNYSFSIAFENCLIDNYVTEKFSHAIEAQLLPVYCIGNNLGKYIDTSPAIMVDTNSLNPLNTIDVISRMPFSEYFDRLTSLTVSYNQLIKQTKLIDCERRMPAKILVDKLKDLLQ